MPTHTTARKTTRNLQTAVADAPGMAIPSVNVRTGTAPLVVQVSAAPTTAPELELQPLFYRGVTYMMPASIVRAPFPTFTFRHLDKVGMFALEGNRPKVVSSLQRAVASAIDAPSLIKIGAVCHSEGCPEEALTSLKKALKVSAKDPDMQALVHASAKTLGYTLDA